MYKTLH